jgi:hypothetical protein
VTDMNYVVGLSVMVSTRGQRDEVRERLNELVSNYSGQFYTSVYSSVVDDEDSTVYEDDMPAHMQETQEFVDENTMNKVRRALFDLLWTDAQIDEAIHALQNAGILFRERR